MLYLIYACLIFGCVSCAVKLFKGWKKTDVVYRVLNYSKTELILSTAVMIPYCGFMLWLAPMQMHWLAKFGIWCLADAPRMLWIVLVHIAYCPPGYRRKEGILRAFGIITATHAPWTGFKITV